MTLTVAIAGQTVTIAEGTLEIDTQINTRSTCKFTVVDSTGALHILNSQQVTVTDSTLGLLFAGFVDTSEEDNQAPNATNTIQVTCKDMTYLADKRNAAYDYENMYAGDIVTDLLQNYLAAEGASAGYAFRNDDTQTAFAQGTLTGATAQNTIAPGDLELSLAGSVVSHTDSVAADWSTGTLSSVTTSGNALVLTNRQGIMITANCVGNQGNNSYFYYKIWSGSYTIQSGDILTYYLWVNANSPQIMAGVDAVCSDGTTVRDFTYSSSPVQNIDDQNHFRAHPKTDLKGWADNRWYYRSIDINPMAGKTITSFMVVFEGDNQGTYTAYFHDILVINGVSTNLTVYAGGNLNASAKVSDIGYANFSISTPTVYDQIGYRNSSAVSLASLGIVQTSFCLYTNNLAYNYPAPSTGASNPTNLTTVAVNTSFDGGATWLPVTNGQTLPGLLSGAATSGMTLMTQILLAIVGPDPTITPGMTGLEWTIYPAYTATKTDYLKTYTGSTSWNSGTMTNLQTFTAQDGSTPVCYQYGETSALTLNGFWRNWDIPILTGQTSYGTSGAGQFAYYGLLQLNTNSGTDVRSQFVFAGQWQNFTASIDVQVPASTNELVGMVYRTTNWVNQNNCTAYSIEVRPNSFALYRGPNAGTTGSATLLQSVTLALTSGDWHTIKAVINGSSHQIYLDEVLYLTVTDATFTGTGYIGARAFNGSGSSLLYYFNNFGVVNALSATWTSPSANLTSIGTVFSSEVVWETPTLTSGNTVAVQISTDGGSTYQPVTNGGSIPQLPQGTSTSGMSLVAQAILTTGNASTTPAFNALTIWIASNYSSSGTRITPSLALTNVTPRADNSSCSWASQSGANTTLFVDTSLDSGTSWQTIVSSGNGIPGLTTLMYLQSVTHSLPKAYYPCNETSGTVLNDYTGLYNGTITGTVTFNQTSALQGPGEVGTGAILFNGTNAFVTLSSSLNTNGLTAFSFECWFQLTNTTYTNQLLLAANDTPTTSHHGFSIALDKSGQSRSGQFILGIASSSTTLNFGSNQLSAGIWYYLVCTYDNVHMTVYLNGSQIAQTTATGAIGTTANAITLMRGPSGSVYFPGTLDSVAVYQTTLSLSTIQTHYNAGINTGPNTYLDFFPVNTSSSYTQTFYGNSGSGATWTWDTTNARLTAVSGTQSALIYPGMAGFDMYVQCDLNQADSAGLAVRMIDKTDLYFAFVCDSSASSNPNTYAIYKMVAGVTTTLVAPTSFPTPFTRGDWHRFKLDIQTYTLTLTMDTTTLTTVTDAGSSLSLAGNAALLAGTTTGQTSNWYSIRVRIHGANVSSLSVQSRQRLNSTNPLATPKITNLVLAVRNTAIQQGSFIPNTNFSQLESKMDAIAKCIDTMASSSNGFLWYLDNNKKLYFQQRTATPAGFYVWSGSGTNGGNVLYADTKPKLTRNDMLYRNRQTVDGGLAVTGPLTRNFIGDGETANWTLDYAVSSIVSITVNGATKLFGVQGVDTGKDFYYALNAQTIVQDSSEVPVSYGSILSIQYYGYTPVRVTVNNTSAQTALAAIDGTSGVVEDYVMIPNIDQTTATTLANGLLQQYGTLGRIFEFVTTQSGLQVGQLLSLNIPQHKLVNVPMLIDKITLTCKVKGDGTLLYFYDVEATEGAILADWSVLFRKLFTSTGF